MTNMQDLKKLGMTELIAHHNALAEKLGTATETSFKSLAAARVAIVTLEEKMTEVTGTESPFVGEQAEAPTDGSVVTVDNGDRGKYNSSGKRGPNQGVGSFAKEQIVAGKTNAEVLAMVKEKFPDAKTTTGCIAFYRTALSKGPGGKSPETLRAEAQALIAKADAVEAARAAAEAAKAAAAEAKAAEPAPTPAEAPM